MNQERISSLRDLWSALRSGPSGSREYRALRTEIAGPIAIYAAIRERDDALAVLFECPVSTTQRMRVRFKAEGISLHQENDKTEGVSRIVATLEQKVFLGVYEVLCLDLIDVAVVGSDAHASFAALGRRMEAWIAFLKRRSAGLSEEEAVGLTGELTCLRMVAEQAGWNAAIAGWMGPDGGVHDFVGNGIAFEVKASLGAGGALWINGLDQLDDLGLKALFLTHVRFVQDSSGITLARLVEVTREQIIIDSPGSLWEFDRKLLSVGFLDHDTGRGPDSTLKFLSISLLRVSEGFPRLIRTSVPTGVSEVRYQLQIQELMKHAIAHDDVMAAMREFGGLP